LLEGWVKGVVVCCWNSLYRYALLKMYLQTCQVDL